MDSHADDRLFGTIIAYVFPGLVMLWGVSYVSPNIRLWLTQVASGDIHTAGFLLLAVAATGLGACANAARWFLFEVVLRKWKPLPGPGLDHTKRKDEGVERAYQSTLLAHYRFYQHAGNTLAAVLTACALWAAGHSGVRVYVFGMLAPLALWILASGAKESQHWHYNKQRRLLGVAEGTDPMSDVNGDEGKGYPPPKPRPQPKPS